MTGLPTVYGVVGNHEAAPCNSFPPKAVTKASSTQQWIYNTLSTAVSLLQFIPVFQVSVIFIKYLNYFFCLCEQLELTHL